MPSTVHGAVKKLIPKETPPDTRFATRLSSSETSEGSYADALAAAERTNTDLESQLLLEREGRQRAEARVTELEMELRMGTTEQRNDTPVTQELALQYKQQVSSDFGYTEPRHFLLSRGGGSHAGLR